MSVALEDGATISFGRTYVLRQIPQVDKRGEIHATPTSYRIAQGEGTHHDAVVKAEEKRLIRTVHFSQKERVRARAEEMAELLSGCRDAHRAACLRRHRE